MLNRSVLLRKGAWFFLFNSFFLLLIASRYFQYFYDVNSFLTISYLFIATVSHFVTLSMLLYVTLFMPVILLLPNKTFAYIWAALVSTLGSLVLLADTFVFKLYHFHMNKFILELLFGGAGSQIFQFHIWQYILVCGTFILILMSLLIISYNFFKIQDKIRFKHGWWIVISLAFMMLSSHFIHAWADAVNYLPITKSSRYYPLYFPTSDNKLMLKLGMVDSVEIKKNHLLFLGDEHKDLNYPKNKLVMDSASHTNIILILIDSWYYKSFDSIAMPHIFKFSQECEVYTHHYSGSNGTRTGVFSLFYSIPGIYWDDVLASQTGSILVDGLMRNKFQIQTFTSASLISPPFDRTIFRKVKDLKLNTIGDQAHDRDKQITNDWISHVNSAKDNTQPLFGFLFYDAMHAISHPTDFKGPFQPEWEYPKYELLNNNTDPKLFLNLYKNAAYFVDSLVGKVLSDLKSKGMLDNSWVIITGDHGQEFNDNRKNYWGHNGNYTPAQMQVPFLLYKPGIRHKIYHHWTSHYDVVPTIFKELFHCKNQLSDYSIGKCMEDSTLRKWLLVGSRDNFSIVQPDRITSVYFDGRFDVTDGQLNVIKNTDVDIKLFNEIMLSSKSFYKH